MSLYSNVKLVGGGVVKSWGKGVMEIVVIIWGNELVIIGALTGKGVMVIGWNGIRLFSIKFKGIMLDLK